MLGILEREVIYLWYYFDIQLRQIFWYWVWGMALVFPAYWESHHLCVCTARFLLQPLFREAVCGTIGWQLL